MTPEYRLRDVEMVVQRARRLLATLDTTTLTVSATYSQAEARAVASRVEALTTAINDLVRALSNGR